MMPRVSVLMAVHNGEEYLEEAVESILSQSFNDFEFIIIDDGSVDSTPRLLTLYEQRDPRIVVYRFDGNRGLAAALNFGIEHAHGEYIARMDADDISCRDRLQKQVAFLDEHPEIAICGSWAEIIGKGTQIVWKYPTEHDAIYARMLFACTLVHSSVILRFSEFEKYKLRYDANIRYAQDYELWSRALEYLRFANLPELLLKHRLHSSSAGAIHWEKQREVRLRIYQRFLSRLRIEYSEAELLLHDCLGSLQYLGDSDFFFRAHQWLKKLLEANQKLGLVMPAALEDELGKRWTHVCKWTGVSSYQTVIYILSAPFPFNGKRGVTKFFQVVTFLAKKSFAQ